MYILGMGWLDGWRAGKPPGGVFFFSIYSIEIKYLALLVQATLFNLLYLYLESFCPY